MSIFRAIASGDAEEVVRLLKTDPTLLQGAHTGWGWGRPSIYAALVGQLDMMKLLVEKGADLHATSRGGTALHMAATKGHEEVVAYLLDNGVSSIHQDQDGNTPLIRAAMDGHARVALLLLQHMAGQGLEARRFDGRTALHWAAWTGHEEVVIQLLNHGARADTTDRDGASAVKTAVENGHVGVVKLLVDRLGPEALQERVDGGRSLLHIASRKAPEQMAEYLLRNGLMPTTTDQHGSTPLMYGAKSGSAKLIGELLEYMNGRGLDARNQGGWTALHWAVNNGRPENVRCLLLAGANPKIVDKDGRTPRALAEQGHHSASVAIFRIVLALLYDMPQWWDDEVQRRFLLYRARTLHDAYTTYHEVPTCPVPGSLKARVEAGLELPQVEVLAGQQYGADWEGDRKRTRAATRAYAAEWSHDLRAMSGLVVEGLSEELFTELLQGFHAWGSEE